MDNKSATSKCIGFFRTPDMALTVKYIYIYIINIINIINFVLHIGKIYAIKYN